MLDHEPLVTVVIPTYRSESFIRRCLLAIKNQTYPHIETVVVDALNYAQDEQERVKAIVEEFATYLQDGPERSIQRNRGMREAKGEYVLVIDQDMYLTPTVVAECIEAMQKSGVVAVLVPEISIGEGFWTKCVALERYVSTYLEEGMNECCRFMRRDDALKIGGYDPAIVGAEDSDFHYRMSALGAIAKIKAHADHDEGRVTFWGRVKKKYYYSRAFRDYLKRRPGVAMRQFFPIKKAYFKHADVLVKQPLVTLGMVVLRSGEVLAGAAGLVMKRT